MAERQDIIEGLKNALERGYSIDIAVSSFINAGYNKQDVEDSAKSFGGNFLQPSPQPIFSPVPKPIQPPQSQVNHPQINIPRQTPQQINQLAYNQAIQTNPMPINQIYKPSQQIRQPQQIQQPRQFQQIQQPLQQYQQPQQQSFQQQPSQLTPIPQQTQSSQSESKSGNMLESKNIVVNAQNVSVQAKPRKKGWGIVIFLIVLLVILLAGLFTLVFAREQVISFLASIGIEF